MAAADLSQIPDVDIDSDGVFKYVLIRVHAAAPSGAPAGESKEIVRGYKWAEYHGEGGAEARGGATSLWAGPATPGRRDGAGLVGGDPVSGLTIGGPRRSGSPGHRGAAMARPGSPSPSAPAQAPPSPFPPPQLGGAPLLRKELLRAGASDPLGPKGSHS